MALLSEGGLSSPDIWIAVAVILTASISIILSPLVFNHNLRKKRSIARDLYMALSAADFITCIVLPIVICIKILRPKEDQCEHQNVTFCQIDDYKHNRTATVGDRAAGSVWWCLAFYPSSITSVLAISRWYQISYPLRVLSRTAVEIFLAVWCLLHTIFFSLSISMDTLENPTLMQTHFVFWNHTLSGADSTSIQVLFLSSTVQTSLSLIATFFTIWSIFRSQAVPGHSEIWTRKIKSIMKIKLLSAGSFFCALIGLSITFSQRDSKIRKVIERGMFFAPILLSVYNPVIYTVLTWKAIFVNKSRIRPVN